MAQVERSGEPQYVVTLSQREAEGLRGCLGALPSADHPELDDLYDKLATLFKLGDD